MNRRRLNRLLIVLALLVALVPYLASRIASPSRGVSVKTTVTGSAKQWDASPQTLRIACYNIAHGRGTAESNWAGGSGSAKMKRLDEIASLLKKIDADVVVLNEVDFQCSWSHGVNQAAYLAKLADYPFRVEQRNVDFRVLFWTWKFGNAVLSRIPIRDAQLINYPPYSKLESALAGKKRGLICELELANHQRADLFAVHLSHRSETIRVGSVRLITELTNSRGNPAIAAGDFNSSPPDFPHSPHGNDDSNAIQLFTDKSMLRRIPKTAPSNPDQFTFQSTDPDRVIDWIFVPAEWKVIDYRVLDSQLSDHRPIVAEVNIMRSSATADDQASQAEHRISGTADHR